MPRDALSIRAADCEPLLNILNTFFSVYEGLVFRDKACT